MVSKIRKFFSILGPGLITGAADDDPSGISTYSVAGATTGYSMLWLTLVSTPMMAVIQGMCARISMVSGEGIAALMRKQLPLWLAYSLACLVIVANTFNLGADIGGMAAATRLVVPVPVDALVFFFGIAMLVGPGVAAVCHDRASLQMVDALALCLRRDGLHRAPAMAASARTFRRPSASF